MPTMLSSTYLALCLFVGQNLAHKDFSNFKLLEAKPTEEKHRQLLNYMDEYFPEDYVDFWNSPNEPFVEYLVRNDVLEDIEKIAKQGNLTYRIKIDNFQVAVEDQMRQIRDAEGDLSFREPGVAGNPLNDFDFFNYHRLDDINDYITQVNVSK